MKNIMKINVSSPNLQYIKRGGGQCVKFFIYLFLYRNFKWLLQKVNWPTPSSPIPRPCCYVYEYETLTSRTLHFALRTHFQGVQGLIKQWAIKSRKLTNFVFSPARLISFFFFEEGGWGLRFTQTCEIF